MKIEANSILEAYKKASNKLNCSILELNSNLIQKPNRGFLGFFKKIAILEFNKKSIQNNIKDYSNETILIKKLHTNKFTIKKISIQTNETEIVEKPPTLIKEKRKIVKKINFDKISKRSIELFENFHNYKSSNNIICDDIKKELKKLLESSCFDIDVESISLINKNTIYIKLDGVDSSLLIGKDGHRYNALSYMLFNWINDKYGLLLKLEIAQFLKNQEKFLEKELTLIYKTVKRQGFAKSKPLSGLKLHLATEILKEKFPDKYIFAKSHKDDTKIIIINELKK